MTDIFFDGEELYSFILSKLFIYLFIYEEK